MATRSSLIAATLLLVAELAVSAAEIERIDPPCWWTGMTTDLQMMIVGDNIGGGSVALKEEVKGLTVAKVTSADSPNYLFVDVKVGNMFTKVPAGKYSFTLTKKDGSTVDFEYEILERRNNSAKRKSFGTEDVIYLLMPDRFENGDTSNDSTDDTIEKSDRKNLGGRHGGDIQGMINRLGYLSSLGVTAVWSTPLLLDDEATYSYHGYACADYYCIDPRYGTNELYKKYVQRAHDSGIKVIMDMVVNHCGRAHWWMEDLPFKDWLNYPENYTLSGSGFKRTNTAMSTHSDPYASEYDKEVCIKGWFDTMMPDINLNNVYARNYMTQMAIWWIEYADLDGLRVDTFPYSDKTAIATWTKNIRSEYPNISIVGECWFGDVLSCSYWEGRKQHDGYNSHLTSVMDFPLRDAIINALNGRCEDWEKSMVKIYNSLALDFVYDDPSDIMIFAGNHDTSRLAHELGGDLDRVKMAYVLLATLRGIPQIYYGDELALRSADGTTGHSQERVDMPSTLTKQQEDLRSFVSSILNWRKTSVPVTTGKFLHFRPTDSNVYVYFRYVKKEYVMVVANASGEDFMVDWDRFSEFTSKYPRAKGRDIISGRKVNVGDTFKVAAGSSAIIEFK